MAVTLRPLCAAVLAALLLAPGCGGLAGNKVEDHPLIASQLQPSVPRSAAVKGEAAGQEKEASPSAPSTVVQPAPPVPPTRVPEVLWEGEWPGKGETGPGVAMNFDNLPVSDFIAQIAEVVPFSYQVTPEVRSRQVTVKTSAPVLRADLFPFMVRVLGATGVVLVKEGLVHLAVPAEQARFFDLPVVGGGVLKAIPAGAGMVVYINYLNHILPAEALEILNPLKAPSTLFLVHPSSKALVMVDIPERVQQYIEIISRLDVPYYQDLQVEFLTLSYAGAEEAAADVGKIVTALFPSRGGEAPVTLIPVKRLNALVLFSRRAGLTARVREWVAKLDQPSGRSGERIFVYHLENGDAKKLAEVLGKIFKDFAPSDLVVDPAPGTVVAIPAARPARVAADPASESQAAAQAQAAATQAASLTAPAAQQKQRQEIVVIPDESSNSIIVRVSPQDYPVVEATIKSLDQAPKQVLIEVLIAEVTLGDENQLGMEWSAIGTTGTGSAGGALTHQATAVFTEGGLSTAATGLSYLVSMTERLTGVVKAYANQSKINILSSPHILTADNKEAMISVGKQVPIVTTETRSAEGTTTDKKVEYKDTGIILKVKPHISASRTVTLEVNQEVSEAQKNLLGGSDSPIILTRKATTTMMVGDGMTLLIGGLIQEKKERTREGIPFLSRIPWLGYLFSYTVDKVARTELVILLTPRVIDDVNEAIELTEPFKDRVRILKRALE
jgi:general secretion pathway protein D